MPLVPWRHAEDVLVSGGRGAAAPACGNRGERCRRSHRPPEPARPRASPGLLDALPAGGRIVMLEPRRLAAVSSARWMARALGEEVGRTVGYAIRFERRVSAATRIEVVTEGILTRRLQSDPGLEGVALVIFDEFHERSLNADLALALCLDARRNLREDLALLVMSATMAAGPSRRFSAAHRSSTRRGKPFPWKSATSAAIGTPTPRASRLWLRAPSNGLLPKRRATCSRSFRESEKSARALMHCAAQPRLRRCDRSAPALRRPAVRGTGARAAVRAPAKSRARHLDRRDESHYRGGAHGCRFRVCAPARARHRLGDGPPRHGAGCTIAGRTARRPCRADLSRHLLSTLLAAGV